MVSKSDNFRSYQKLIDEKPPELQFVEFKLLIESAYSKGVPKNQLISSIDRRIGVIQSTFLQMRKQMKSPRYLDKPWNNYIARLIKLKKDIQGRV